MNELELLKKHRELALRLIDAKDEEMDKAINMVLDFLSGDSMEIEKLVHIVDRSTKLKSQLNEVNENLKKIS